MKILEYYAYLVQWIKHQVKQAGLKGVIVGLSGGVDSAVVASLAHQAFPETAWGVYLPIENMGQDLIDAKLVAQKIGIKTLEVDLTAAFLALTKTLKVNRKLAIANLKPRLRMSALYALAQEKDLLVLGTDNAAEWMLGYFTKYGDGGVDLLPLVHLCKGDVKALAKVLDLPPVVYTKAPTAALWENQSDEAELGFTYEQVDKFLKNEAIEEKVATKIKQQIQKTAHKRKALPMPKPWGKTLIF